MARLFPVLLERAPTVAMRRFYEVTSSDWSFAMSMLEHAPDALIGALDADTVAVLGAAITQGLACTSPEGMAPDVVDNGRRPRLAGGPGDGRRHDASRRPCRGEGALGRPGAVPHGYRGGSGRTGRGVRAAPRPARGTARPRPGPSAFLGLVRTDHDGRTDPPRLSERGRCPRQRTGALPDPADPRPPLPRPADGAKTGVRLAEIIHREWEARIGESHIDTLQAAERLAACLHAEGDAKRARPVFKGSFDCGPGNSVTTIPIPSSRPAT